ncbi:hypothetical protein BN940_11721 [Castellaniella defragrans 65Phen]|uniref:Uncharacterized protein n=1 Tax=Castellaniella defragrans (strain DSM 12143 / CCUG 39792 / 65Phen) TaxID=1437824 RepID=W8X4G2_CASD6|nr:hypothetical protein BN940_11721 [Castellaniella defragrans 65Phen]
MEIAEGAARARPGQKPMVWMMCMLLRQNDGMLAAIMAAIGVRASPEKPRFWGLVRMIRPVRAPVRANGGSIRPYPRYCGACRRGAGRIVHRRPDV